MADSRWTAVVINYNGAGYLEACLDALGRTSPQPADVIVVDNASSDDSLVELHGYPKVNVLALPRNLGFAGGANAGLAAVETEYALVLNPDVEVDAEIGAALVAAFERDRRLGAAGALMLFPDGRTIQHAGGIIYPPLMATRHHGYGLTYPGGHDQELDVDYVAGGAMAVRLDAFREVGGFDERFTPVYYEDVDLCVRLRAAGWAVRYVPAMRALHHEGSTLGLTPTYFHHINANRLRFAMKHLSARQWREEFVPAEIARLRDAVYVATDEHWPATTGLSGLEAVVANPRESDGARGLAPVRAEPMPGVRSATEVAKWLAVLPERPEPTQGRFEQLLQQRITNTNWQQWVEESLSRQQEFNQALIAALEAQDQANREQIVLVLLLALDLVRQLGINPDEPA